MNRASDAEKPGGFRGRLSARIMGIGHRPIYKGVAASLDLKPEDDLLDIGCGSGTFIKKFASHTRHAAGVDHSEDMVRLSSHYNRKRVQNGTAEFKLGEAARLPWKDQSFSAVSMIETFYWVKPGEALKEIFRVLRPGGRLAIATAFNADDGQDHTKYARTFHMNLYSEDQMRTLLEQSGFSKISFTFARGFGLPRIMIARASRPFIISG